MHDFTFLYMYIICDLFLAHIIWVFMNELHI